MNSPREFIEEFAAKQYGKDFPCPRCGRQSMNINPSKNALSRRAGVQICDECGMLEALEAVSYTHLGIACPDSLSSEPASQWPSVPSSRCV